MFHYIAPYACKDDGNDDTGAARAGADRLLMLPVAG
jgi:hypothetical protein